jgi:hypothetical protein
MLKLPEFTRVDPLKPRTAFKLFDYKNDVGPSVPKARNRGTSCSRKTPCADNSANENEGDSGPNNTVEALSPLPINDALSDAISQVELPMDGLIPPHIFKLFTVLVNPPKDLDLNAIDGLHGYLTKLLLEVGSLLENGVREVTSHCWWVLLSKCSHIPSRKRNFYILTVLCNENERRKRANWVAILNMLKTAKMRLLNWSTVVNFPTSGSFPRKRGTLRKMAKMFLHPDPTCRLRLVPIAGMSHNQLSSCDGTDINYSRSSHREYGDYHQPTHSGQHMSCMHARSRDYCCRIFYCIGMVPAAGSHVQA